MKKVLSLALFFILLLSTFSFTVSAADVTVVDFNNKTIASTWTKSAGNAFLTDTERTNVGSTYSAKWSDTVTTTWVQSPTLSYKDWSASTYVNVRLYSNIANGATIGFNVHGLDTNSEEFYFRRTFKLDFTGWKIMSFPLAIFSSSSTASNWKNIQYIKLTSSGWNTTPLLSTQLNFDKIWLSNEIPVETTCSAISYDRNEYEGVTVSVDVRAEEEGTDAVMVAELYNSSGNLSKRSTATVSNATGTVKLSTRLNDTTSTDLRVTVYKDLGKTKKLINTENIDLTKKDGAQVVILKFDDVKMWSYDGGFRDVKEYLDSVGVVGSFGVIANELEDQSGVDKTGLYNFIKECEADGHEIWHHGYLHTVEEYSTATSADMLTNFKKANDLVLKKTGIQMKTFGSPYNNASQTAIDMIANNFPGYKTFMYVSTNRTFPSGAINYSNYVTVETTTAEPSYELFLQNYAGHENDDYILIQIHPWNCTTEKVTQLTAVKNIVQYLKNRNCEFMTPYEYHERLKNSK